MATGPHIVHPESLGPVIHRSARAVPDALDGEDTDDEAGETVLGAPIVVVLVTDTELPERTVLVEVVMPVLLLTVLTVVVLLGALAIYSTSSPAETN
jgi:hypothetical protein